MRCCKLYYFMLYSIYCKKPYTVCIVINLMTRVKFKTPFLHRFEAFFLYEIHVGSECVYLYLSHKT